MGQLLVCLGAGIFLSTDIYPHLQTTLGVT